MAAGVAVGAVDVVIDGFDGVLQLSEAERLELGPSEMVSAAERVLLLQKKIEEAKRSILTTPARLKNLEALLRRAEELAKLEERPVYMRKRHEERLQELEASPILHRLLTPSLTFSRLLAPSQERLQELEAELTDDPFTTLDVMSGSEGANVKVCTLKLVACLNDGPVGQPLPKRSTDLLSAIMKPREFVVRVYVLEGRGLSQRDPDSPSDPYLRLKLGGTTLDSRACFLKDETNPVGGLPHPTLALRRLASACCALP